MDTIKLLLGATIALLLAAVVISWQGMVQGVRDTPADEIARLQKQVTELRLEGDRLKQERELQQLRSAAPVSSAPAPLSSSERQALEDQLAAKEAALKSIEEEKAKAVRDADTYRDEAGFVAGRELEKNDSELRRARLISDALVMARVREFVDDPQLGGFVTVEILMPENVQQGTVLAIRRKTGIIGQIRISEITSEGTIGNLLPGIAKFVPEPGDELILPPEY